MHLINPVAFPPKKTACMKEIYLRLIKAITTCFVLARNIRNTVNSIKNKPFSKTRYVSLICKLFIK